MEKVINIVICDDENSFLEELYGIVGETLKNFKYKFNIVKKNSGFKLIEYCECNEVDVVLTDIDMPGMSGFEAIQKLQSENPGLAVIFVTAHEEYAYQAYDYQPFWFVSKRDKERIGEIVNKLVKKIIFIKCEEEIIPISGDKIVNINLKETMYLKSDKHYMVAYQENGEMIKFRNNIKDVYKQLEDSGFVDIHRSYIVNCRFIERFNYEYLLLNNGEKIPITRKQKKIKEAQRKYGEFLRKIRW